MKYTTINYSQNKIYFGHFNTLQNTRHKTRLDWKSVFHFYDASDDKWILGP